MTNVNQTCASILEKVTSSGLDFSIHQTPYSIHFSLRRKFSKHCDKIPLDYSSPLSSPENQDDRLQQQLLYTRKEYEKLYNLYLIESEAKQKLEEDYCKVLENVTKVENKDENVKAMKVENKALKEKLETKSLEFKQLKNDFDNVNKDKNALSVALKAAKAENKEQLKEFEKKKVESEKKLEELSEFKKIKLAEEREEKLRKRKELKKANQKLKKESKEQNLEKVADTEKLKSNTKPSKTDQTNCNMTEDTLGRGKDTNSNDNPETTNDEGKSAEVLDEKCEKNLGPKLPLLMNQEEKDAFLNEIFAKVDKNIGELVARLGVDQ